MDSPIHRLHPMSKLVVTCFYILIVISFPPQNLSGMLSFLIYPVCAMTLSGIPLSPLFKRFSAALPFALMGGISNLILNRTPVLMLGNGFIVSQGLLSCLSIMLKTLFTVFAVLILVATTSFLEITNQLAVLHVPKILCLQLVMIYRYLSLLVLEAATMVTSYKLRAPNEKGIRFNDMGVFLGQLILRSFDRAERVYQAMKCRGFDGVYYVPKHEKPSGAERCGALLLMLSMIGLRLFNVSLFFGRIIR